MVWWPFDKKAKDEQSQNSQDQGYPFSNGGTAETKTYSRSYSSSKSCRPDQEDPQYIICKEKVQDGNNSYENQERIPVKQYTNNGIFRGSEQGMNESFNQNDSFFGSTGNVFSLFDNFFNPNFPAFAAFPTAFPTAFNHEQGQQNSMPAYYQQRNNTQNPQQSKRQNPRYYFSSKTQTDYSIRDL